MPRGGTGTYTLPAGNPVVTLTTISSTWANTTMADIATAITGSLALDGSTSMSGALKLADGTVAAPGLSFSAAPNTGFRRPTTGGVTGDLAFVVGGQDVGYADLTGIIAVGSFGLSGAFAGAKSNGLYFDTAMTLQTNVDININALTAGKFINLNSANGVLVAAPTAGTALQVNSAVGGGVNCVSINSTQATGVSFGLAVIAGTSSADYSARFNSKAGLPLFTVRGDGMILIPNITVASSATAGIGSALPATPAGYLNIIINSVAVKMPYYLP